MTVFHFGNVLEDGIRGGFKKCPSFRKMVNHERLREACKLLRKKFPNHEKLRHSVAHSGEMYADLDKSQQHYADKNLPPIIFAAPGIGIAIRDTFYNHTFINTIEGTTVKLDMTPESLRSLFQVYELAVSAFPARR